MMRSKKNIFKIKSLFIVFLLTISIHAQQKSDVGELAKQIAYISAPSLYEVDYAKLNISLKQIIEENSSIKAVEIVDTLSNMKIFKAYKNQGQIIYQKDLPVDINRFSKLEIDSVFDNELVGKVIVYYDNESYFDLTLMEKKYLQEKKSIRMCNKLYRNPLEYRNEDGKMEGIAIDTMKLLEKKIGHNIIFEHIESDTWDTSKRLLQENRCDIVSAISYSKKREKVGNFTQPYLNFKFVIVTRTDEPFMEDIESIKSKGVTRKKGSGLIKKLKNKYSDIKIIETKNYDEAFLRVGSGEVYATIATTPVAMHYISKHGLTNLKISGYLNLTSELSVLVRKEDKTLLDILNKALKSITYEEQKTILEKYTRLQVDGRVDYSLVWKIIFVFFVILALFLYNQRILKRLNTKLEKKIKEEVEKNRKKDSLLAQQSKMAAMGEMLENIAHQWRQPLSVISASSADMRIQKALGVSNNEEGDISSLDEIDKSVQHLSKTIDDFRNFFRSDKNMSIFNLKDAYNKTMDLVTSKFQNKDIEIIEDIEDIRFYGLESELIQVIMNLLNNARDVLENKADQRKLIFINIYSHNNKAILKIKDNGGGIPNDIIDKIFEPYFTTKHKSQGTGIGLYMSQNIIVKNLHGIIEVKNNEYKYENKNYIGAEFTITLDMVE